MFTFIIKKTLAIFISIVILITLGSFFATQNSKAAINKQFNYQGKLTDTSGVAIVDGAYDVVLKLYTVAGGGSASWTESWTNAALWTETASTTVEKDHADCGGAGYTKITYVTTTNESTLAAEQAIWNTTKKESAVIKSATPASDYICIYNSYTDWISTDDLTNRVYVKDGLFSAMVGTITAQTVDFTAATYYLGVTIGADSEMIPRKRIGAVPQAWNANNVVGDGYIDIDNTSTSQDAVNINYNPASGTYNALDITYGSGGGTGTALSVIQSGAGNIINLTGDSITTGTGMALSIDGLTTGTGLDITSTSTAGGVSGTSKLLNLSRSGANTNTAHTAYGLYSAVTNTNATSGTNIGGYFSASGATTANYGLIVENGDVGIGAAAPTEKLHLNAGNFLQTPSDPTTKGNWDPNDANIMEEAYSVYVSGKYAYVVGSTSDNLAIVDISNPASPTTIGNWDPGDTNIMNGARSVYVSGKYAYVAGYYSDNLAIVDISNPASPTTIGNWDPGDTNIMDGARSVYVSGKYAYVAGYTSDNLAIVDISNPASPTTIGNWDPGDTNIMDSARSVYVSGKYAYVAGYTSDNLAIVDISNPALPTTKGNWDPNDANIMDETRSVYVSGKYAYVAGCYSDNLAIVDISNPASPTTIGNWDPNDTNIMNGAYSVYVSGKYAYVTGHYSNNLAIVDISNPASPTTIGNWDPSDTNIMSNANSVYVSGKYAYVTGMSSNNMVVVDISGIDVPTAHIGDLAVGTIDVWENMDVANNLHIGGGLNVGPGGIYSQGRISAYESSSATALSITQSSTGSIVNLTGDSITTGTGMALSIDGLTTGTGLDITSTSTAGGVSGTSKLLNLARSGVNANDAHTAYGLYSAVTNTNATSGTNIGGYFSASGATTANYGLIVENGDVGIGTAAPIRKFDVLEADSVAQMRVSQSSTVYAEFYVAATTGDLTITTAGTGDDIIIYDDTLQICESGACPSVTGQTGAGDLIVENEAYFSGDKITYPSDTGFTRPKRTIILTAAGAITPTTNGADQAKVDGTNFTYYTLDFDQTTDESAFWEFTVPDSFDATTNSAVTVYWTASAGTATNGVSWKINTLGRTDDEVFDSALGTELEIEDALTATGDIMVSSEGALVDDWATGEYAVVKVYRDADAYSGTNLTADAKLLKIKIEYSVTKESD